MRIGIGYDVHRLGPGRALILGGVRIEYDRCLVGHSDADVVIHALIDALLGAAGLGDIGEHFPDSDEAYRRADSAQLLARVVGMLKEHRFTVGNVDIIIMAERPKLTKYKPKMKARLAAILGIDGGLINVKAKTAEGLGPVGREEALAAWAAVTIDKM